MKWAIIVLSAICAACLVWGFSPIAFSNHQIGRFGLILF